MPKTLKEYFVRVVTLQKKKRFMLDIPMKPFKICLVCIYFLVHYLGGGNKVSHFAGTFHQG